MVEGWGWLVGGLWGSKRAMFLVFRREWMGLIDGV